MILRVLGAGPGWRITHTVLFYYDSQHQSATNPGTWVNVEKQSSWAQVHGPLGKFPGYPVNYDAGLWAREKGKSRGHRAHL